MKLIRNVLWAELFVQLVLAILMIFWPFAMQKLIFVPQPDLLVQTIGVMAFSMVVLVALCLENFRQKTLVYVVCVVLAVFNAGLSVALLLCAWQGLLSWLGVIVHLPFAVAFIFASLYIKKGEAK